MSSSGVVVLPGEDCGLSPFFRINFALARSALEKGLPRIAEGLGWLR